MTQVYAKCKQVLLLIRHPRWYSYIKYTVKSDKSLGFHIILRFRMSGIDYFRFISRYIYIYIYIRLKIKPNSVRIRFQSCQIIVLPSTGFEPTPLLHCSTIRLALRPAPQTTRLHPLPKKRASIIIVLHCTFSVRQIQGYT